MQSTSLLKKLPINISIYEKNLTDNILKDSRLIELLDIVNNKDYIYKYQYALYSDTNNLKHSIFIPVFHTMYLACVVNNVVISNKEDFWLLDIFPNNKYYILEKKIEPDVDYVSKNIKIIKQIGEIENI